MPAQGMAEIRDQEYPVLGRRETTGAPIHDCWERRMMQAFRKTVWKFLITLNIYLPYGIAILLLSIYPGKISTYIYQKYKQEY